MMKIFKYLVGFVFFLLTPILYADVTINNTEKDAKVKNNASVSRANLPSTTKVAGSNADVWQLHAEQWELTRSGESILSLPVLNKVMMTWMKDKSRTIEIHYPGGEEGEFWVQESLDWLVSLGVPSSHMLAVPGSGTDDVIKFFIAT